MEGLEFGPPNNIVTFCNWRVDITTCGQRFQTMYIIATVFYGLQTLWTLAHIVCLFSGITSFADSR